MIQQATTLVAVVAAFGLGSASGAESPADLDRIQNWPAPLFWQPSVSRDSARPVNGGRIREEAIGKGAAGSIGLLAVFVALPPCRVLDTRSSLGSPWGGAFAAGETRDLPMPSSPTCAVPSGAVAYSLNVTVVPVGSVMRFLSIWDTGSAQPTVSTLNDKLGTNLANAAVVPAGTGGAISVFVTDATDVLLDINGYYRASVDSLGNTFFGPDTLSSNTLGTDNTAIGSQALMSNSTGTTNTAIGFASLLDNQNGQANTAIGVDALAKNTSGGNNTAIGNNALSVNTIGNNNTAIGTQALAAIAGSNNFAIGYSAGTNALKGDWNVFIANPGQAADTNLIRIGDTHQNATFITGISGVGVSGGTPVVVASDGQLGIASSSRRFKQDVQDMGDTTGTIMALHPVRFHYKASGPDSPTQYGLIAEDVAAIAPELVIRDGKGEILSVHYDKVNAMMLNQVQEQQRLLEKQRKLIEELESRIADLENRDNQ